jgi:flagellar biosynthesis/type III secretory pathway chaperone
VTAPDSCVLELQSLLENENAALERMDISIVIALSAEKMRLVDRFRSLREDAGPGTIQNAGKDPRARLSDLCRENKKLLERAIIAQRRLLGMVLEASKPPVTTYSRYGGSGCQVARPRAMIAQA